MKLFKKFKKETEKKITETEIKENDQLKNETKLSLSNDLRVETESSYYIIFTDNSNKYICINKDYNNHVTFDSYIECFNRTLLLKKGECYALCYYNSAIKSYSITDFIFVSYEIVENAIVLNNKEGLIWYYTNYTLLENITSYYSTGEFYFVFEYKDYKELYYIENSTIEFIYKAKSFELFYIKHFPFDYNIVKYELDTNKFGYLIMEGSFYITYSSKNKTYKTLDLVCIDESLYFIATDEDDKPFFFPIFNYDEISKKYDKLKVANNLFLAFDGKVAKIINYFEEVLYESSFEDISKFSLKYNDDDNLYTLYYVETPVITIELCVPEDNEFYTIYVHNENSKMLHNTKGLALKDNYITYYSYGSRTIYEFENSYLYSYIYYFLLSKDAPIDQILKQEVSFFGKYLKEIIVFNENTQTFESLDKTYIELITKCNVWNIIDIVIDNSISIKGNSHIGKFRILDSNITIDITDDCRLELKAEDIKTDIVDLL